MQRRYQLHAADDESQHPTRRQLMLEAMMHGRDTLRVYAHVRQDGAINSAEAIEIHPDGTEQQRAILCYRSEIERAASTLRRMARAHQRAATDPATVLGLIDGEYWFRELTKAADPRNVFAPAVAEC